MSYAAVIELSVGATVFFALSTALKHRSATLITPARGRRGTVRVVHFLRHTVRHPWWLAGLLADAAGLGLQAAALHLGAVSVVQPVLVSAIVTSLVLGHLTARTRISRRELGWGVLLVVAIAAFLVASGAPKAVSQEADHGVAAMAGLLAVGIAAGSIVLARHLRRGGRAATIGVAVGTSYACTAVLLKAVTNVAADHGVGGALSSWQLPALILSGAAGMALAQLAFRAGPLNASLPAIATVDPLASVALGVAVYDEHLRTGTWAVTGQVVALVVLAVAATALSRVRAEQGSDATGPVGE
ncbi:DMT family transporter [Pedococcus sp. 5OH_020]|uniref:DMT family transporter n=1 Tax=Pedococcus sp. 5OH_020 TaxID=2989814 RepID=UPI0022E9A706|nr:DMT family transporter [Pedococcus sp. 5OH_020]